MTFLTSDPRDKTAGDFSPVSTGHLPPADRVQALIETAYERFKSNDAGHNADYYPALAGVPRDLFGICVAGANGTVNSAGDTDYPFTIMSVAKPFIFALVCQAMGAEQAHAKLGVNGTGLAFNSVMAIELNVNQLTNPMVNSGALATTSLAPGQRSRKSGSTFMRGYRGSLAERWR